MNGLIELRRRLRKSQAELGAAIGLGQSAISQCERGGCWLSPESAIKLVEYAKSQGVTTSLDEIYLNQSQPPDTEAVGDSSPPDSASAQEVA